MTVPLRAAPGVPPTAPVIAVYSRATVALGVDSKRLVWALQHYVDQYLTPAWDVTAVLKLTDAPLTGAWGMVFLDDSDSPGALAYHEEDSGLPLAKVFVKTTLAAGDSISVSASHELAEMLVDPACNRYAMASAGKLYALEACDPVEETSFPVGGIHMSDFVLPAWFDVQAPIGSKVTHMGTVRKPFQLASGGYAITMEGNGLKTQWGSKEKEARFALEDRRGHRSEYRREITSHSGDRPYG